MPECVLASARGRPSIHEGREPVVIVTGATGFVGQDTVSRLEQDGQAYLALGRRESDEELLACVADVAPSQRSNAVLIHLAGLADGVLAQQEPERALQEIVGFALRAVDASLSAGLAKCVLVSSGMVYGQSLRLPMTEDAPLNPQGVYAGAKAAMEMLARGRVIGERFALEIVRLGNVIGPGMRRTTVVGEILGQLRQHPERVELNSLEARRDYLHVRDVARALVAIARLAPSGQQVRCWNVGTGIGTSVRELCQLITSTMGLQAVELTERRVHDIRAFDIALDSQALRQATGWKPEVTLAEALEELVRHA